MEKPSILSGGQWRWALERRCCLSRVLKGELEKVEGGEGKGPRAEGCVDRGVWCAGTCCVWQGERSMAGGGRLCAKDTCVQVMQLWFPSGGRSLQRKQHNQMLVPFGIWFYFTYFLKLFYCSFTVVCIFSPPQPNPPPSPASTLPLGFVHAYFIVVPENPSPHYPLPTPLWLLFDCS